MPSVVISSLILFCSPTIAARAAYGAPQVKSALGASFYHATYRANSVRGCKHIQLRVGYMVIVIIDRRQLLIGSAASSLALGVPPVWALTGIPQTRAVHIIFLPTGEKYEGFYYQDGHYNMAEVQQFSWVCRDYRANQWKWLHPHLMD